MEEKACNSVYSHYGCTSRLRGSICLSHQGTPMGQGLLPSSPAYGLGRGIWLDTMWKNSDLFRLIQQAFCVGQKPFHLVTLGLEQSSSFKRDPVHFWSPRGYIEKKGNNAINSSGVANLASNSCLTSSNLWLPSFSSVSPSLFQSADTWDPDCFWHFSACHLEIPVIKQYLTVQLNKQRSPTFSLPKSLLYGNSEHSLLSANPGSFRTNAFLKRIFLRFFNPPYNLCCLNCSAPWCFHHWGFEVSHLGGCLNFSVLLKSSKPPWKWNVLKDMVWNLYQLTSGDCKPSVSPTMSFLAPQLTSGVGQVCVAWLKQPCEPKGLEVAHSWLRSVTIGSLCFVLFQS